MKKTFSEKVREKRKELNMTLEELGEKISSTKAYVWELENKKTNARPSAEKLLKIADALEVSPDYLINDNAEDDDENYKDTAFFRKFKKLSDKDKEILKQFATTMYKVNNEKE